jgi:serine/threonine-protein kinase TTK/MPS1
LNCALLNDSFILSPSKDIEYSQTPQAVKKPDENNKNLSNVNDSGFGASRVTEIPIIANDENKEVESNLKIAYRPIRTRQELFPTKPTTVLQDKAHDKSVPSIFKKIDANSSHQNETPFKQKDSNDPVFLTPSIRQPSQSTIKKSQNIPLQTLSSIKEKPPAKILFTTPIARPNFTGSLIESTPLEMKKITTATNKKLSPITEPTTEKPKTNLLSINNIEYLIDKKIGSGGSSSVFLATQTNTDKEVAIKLVNLDGDQQVVDGYLNETKLLAKLQGNINVVSLLDYCHLPQKNILYMVMEKGESDLHKILQGYRTHLPLYTLVTYWHQMLQAVNYIHANGVIHSDLKPANFLMINGRLKLIDFGIASNIAIDSTSIIKFSQAGTFNYISPEALIDTSTGDSPSTHNNQPKIRLSTKSDVSCH